MYRGLGSDQHERKNALKTSGYWIVAVIRDNTLSLPKVIKKQKFALILLEITNIVFYNLTLTCLINKHARLAFLKK